ncbi:alpha/beta hydrolase family protein [Planctobacterium marinum]|uniref:Prolyl oligopeptidase n=1 Tax=Planctobacterium marinum TaxID=1631968 RepID=A0AA48HLQ7_9ALTE|nr:prolyl oligopeptidase [Planctobacterium marinum]
MNKITLFFILFFFGFVVTAAEELVPLEVFGALPQISMMEVSPSGNRIAYRVAKDNKEMYVIYDLAKKEMVTGVDISNIRPKHAWFVDEDTLIMVTVDNTRLFGFQGRHDISAAFSFKISENRIRQLLTPGDGIYAGQTNLGTIVGLSNDGQFAYMPAFQSQSVYSLMKVRISGKRTPRPVSRGTHDAVNYFIYNDELIARERFDNRKNLHRVEVRENDEWREIYRQETEIPTRSFEGLTADLKSLVMVAQNGQGRWGYFTMALADGQVSGPFFEVEDKDVEYVLTDHNRIVHGVRYSGFKPSYDFFDPKIQTVVDGVAKDLPDYTVTLVSYSPDWQHMIFMIEGIDSPGDFYFYTKGQFYFIASGRPDIPANEINQVFQTEIKARDGLRLPTLLTLPAVDELKNLPAIMLPHGGPESYDRIGFDWLAQYFASRGYLVMQPQFRGSEGFGLELTLKGRGEWGRKMQDDLTDTVNTLVKSGYVDPDRVCIVGISYGGYAALAGAAFTPDVYQCAISINGVADLERMLRDERRDYGKNHWVVAYWQKLISEGKVDEAHIKAISPINHIDKIKIPVLLVHGTHDEVVPDHQSENMFDELQDADVDAQYLELEQADHSLSKAPHRMAALQAIDKFISKHIPVKK